MIASVQPRHSTIPTSRFSTRRSTGGTLKKIALRLLPTVVNCRDIHSHGLAGSTKFRKPQIHPPLIRERGKAEPSPRTQFGNLCTLFGVCRSLRPSPLGGQDGFHKLHANRFNDLRMHVLQPHQRQSGWGEIWRQWRPQGPQGWVIESAVRIYRAL